MSRKDAYTQRETRVLIELIEKGQPLHAIAAELHRSEHSVRQKATKLRKVMPELPRQGARLVKVVVALDGACLSALKRYCEHNGTRVNDLAAALLAVMAVEQNLIDAVLDRDDDA